MIISFDDEFSELISLELLHALTATTAASRGTNNFLNQMFDDTTDRIDAADGRSFARPGTKESVISEIRGVFPWRFEKYTPPEKYPRYKKRPYLNGFIVDEHMTLLPVLISSTVLNNKCEDH